MLVGLPPLCSRRCLGGEALSPSGAFPGAPRAAPHTLRAENPSMFSMRCNRAVGLAVAAGSTMFVGTAVAQTVVYDNTVTPTNIYFGSLAANTNDSAESGDQIL